MGSLTGRLPYEEQSRFRLGFLEALLHAEPAYWRIRRTDTFTPIDHTTFQQETIVDVRIRRSDLTHELVRLRESMTSGERRRAVAKLVAAERDALINGTYLWDSADIFVPVLWVYGPLMDLQVRCDDATVVPLARYQTAAVVARAMGETYRGLAGELVELPPDIEELLWISIATDPFALGPGEALLAELKPSLSLEDGAVVAAFWMALVADRLGLDLADVLDNDNIEKIETVLADMKQLLAGRYDARDVSQEAWLDPLWNPLLLFDSFLKKRLAWDRRNADGMSDAPEPGPLVQDFLSMCQTHVGLISWAQTTDDDVMSWYVWESLRQVARYWPLVVRCQITPDRAHRFQVELKGRFVKKCSRSEHFYPLSDADSQSYHVYVATPHNEITLKADGGVVEWPRRDYRGSWRKQVFEGRRWAHRFFKPARVSAEEYFNRSDDRGPVAHSFYDAPLTPETIGLPDYIGEKDTGDPPFLVVAYKVLGYVRRTNALVATLLVLLASYMVYLSLVGAVTPDAVATVPFFEISKSALTLFFAVLLLFTIERHNNPLIARRLRPMWVWVITSTALVGLSSFAWAARVRPAMVPFGLATPLAEVWTGLAEWMAWLSGRGIALLGAVSDLLLGWF